MEVRKGYKQIIGVGVIPEDWEVDTLSSTTPRNVKNGIVDGPFGSNLKTIHYRKSGIPIITSGYVTEGNFHAEDYLYVDNEKFKQEKRSAVDAGDIVMAKIGARCGASAILPKWHQTGILSGNALKITVDNTRHSTYYIWQVLWNLYLRGSTESLKTVGAQPAISMATLKKYKIPLPPLPEQTAIANALSDADALISRLEKLIAKKRHIKQGAMQLLLTGKKRLPGFSGEWEIKRLGEIADILKGSGLSKSKLISDGNSKCVLYGELFTTYKRVIRNVVSCTNSSEGRNSIKGDVLLPGSTTTIGIDLAIASALLEDDVLLGGDIIIVRKKGDSYNPEYLALYLTLVKKYAIAKLAQGITIFHLHGKDLIDLEIEAPSVDEQTAIAQVISDMDAEIEELERKLSKYRLIKQGMMQELLTGKKRLI